MAALERLNAMLQGQGYTTHFVQGKGTFTGQDVAMLSRMEPNSVGRVEGKGESGGERKQVTKTLVTTIVKLDAVVAGARICQAYDAGFVRDREDNVAGQAGAFGGVIRHTVVKPCDLYQRESAVRLQVPKSTWLIPPDRAACSSLHERLFHHEQLVICAGLAMLPHAPIDSHLILHCLLEPFILSAHA